MLRIQIEGDILCPGNTNFRKMHHGSSYINLTAFQNKSIIQTVKHGDCLGLLFCFKTWTTCHKWWNHESCSLAGNIEGESCPCSNTLKLSQNKDVFLIRLDQNSSAMMQMTHWQLLQTLFYLNESLILPCSPGLRKHEPKTIGGISNNN